VNQSDKEIDEPQYQEPQAGPGAAHIDRGRTTSKPGIDDMGSTSSSDGSSIKGDGGAKQSGRQKVVPESRTARAW
jgi:hypothetical protein